MAFAGRPLFCNACGIASYIVVHIRRNMELGEVTSATNRK
jgi:hypothetical protein